jgi:hypothetical protein
MLSPTNLHEHVHTRQTLACSLMNYDVKPEEPQLELRPQPGSCVIYRWPLQQLCGGAQLASGHGLQAGRASCVASSVD